MKLFEDLEARGLVKQATNTEKIRELLNEKKVTFYIGFDPTANSLHVGHLLQMITAKRLANAGHIPIMLIGGATAQIGDPSGKSSMRPMLEEHVVEANIKSITPQIKKIVGVDDWQIINNKRFFQHFTFLSFIREFGPLFSVNNMLRADCFKSRLETGLSFLEFNYMLMQAVDFFRLFVWRDCILQIGGDDQWSNILAGIDLIHKKEGKESFGLTIPLLTTSDGTKMGKTEKGAVWLSEEGQTSIFDFFQFWRNIPDAEVMKCFKQLTFLSLQEIATIPFTTVEEINAAKKRLACELTTIVHGKDATDITLEVVESLFEKKDPSIMEAAPIDDNTNVLDLIVKCEFAKSRTDARNLINNKGITINTQVLDNPTLIISKSQFGKEIIVKKGKKSFKRFMIEE
jgi:tyrosyl-tRNA synthetase